MQVNVKLVIFTVLFGGMGLALMALGDYVTGYLMCCGVLLWLFIVNNTGHLFIETDDDNEDYEND
jgi:hypothetical protein